MGKVLGAVGGVVGNAIAPGIGGVIGGAIGDVAGGAISSSASNKAAKGQQAAADQSLALQKEMYDTNRADLQPFRDVGYQANTKLSQLMGLNAPDPAKAREDMRSKYNLIFGGGQQKPTASAQQPTQAAGDNAFQRSLGLAGDPNLPSGNKFSSNYHATAGVIDTAKYQAFSEERAAKGLPPISPADYYYAGQPAPTTKKLSQYMGVN